MSSHLTQLSYNHSTVVCGNGLASTPLVNLLDIRSVSVQWEIKEKGYAPCEVCPD